MISDITISQHGIRFAAKVPELAKGFIWWNAKDVRSPDNVDCCDDRIERTTCQMNIFSNGKVCFRFVETETEMQLTDVIQSCVKKTEFVVDQEAFFVEEDKI